MPRTAGVRRLPALPAFEDWTPPWKVEEFDAEKAKKLVYDLHKDKETLFAELDTKATEIEDLEDEADELEAKVAAASKTGAEAPKEGEDQIAALRREIAELKAGATEKPKTRREIREAKKAEQETGDNGSMEAAKYRIALEKGLSAADARRLVGKTEEELEADADKFLEEHGTGSTGSGQQGAGKGGQAPPSQRPKAKVKTGTAADGAEEEITDPGKLYDEVLGG